jgi:hypothetical protein
MCAACQHILSFMYLLSHLCHMPIYLHHHLYSHYFFHSFITVFLSV